MATTGDTSYAQFGEDTILAVLLQDVSHGFYVDIGANYETRDSVTKYFYQMGWSGINVEPVPELCRELKAKRRRDINLNIGISASGRSLTFRQYDTHGHSTFSKGTMAQKSQHYNEYKVKTRTLRSVFDEYVSADIHFMKVDVEGFEYEVIKSNDWLVYRPRVVCVEANHINRDWRPILHDAKYDCFIKDGLNEYYIAKEWWGILTQDFAERIVRKRATTLSYDQRKRMNQLTHKLLRSEARNEKLRHELQQYISTSYLNRSFSQKITLAARSFFANNQSNSRYK